MGLLGKIAGGTRELHRETENKPFLKHYPFADKLTLLDHYRHLNQLLPIYELLEIKMAECDDSLGLSSDFLELLTRSAQIQEDLLFLARHLPVDDKKVIHLPDTKVYLDYLQQLTAKDDRNAILGHFLVRILGDLFGGQSLKNYVRNMYIHQGITSSEGLAFYQFSPDMLKRFTQSWLNQPHPIDEDEVVKYANESFRYHMNIFDSLEAIRRPHRYCGLFSTKHFIAGAITATAVATATFIFS